jgi:D-aspartate ligase
MTRPPVVIVGLDCPTGLQTSRVFASRGIDVIGLANNAKHPCARTRSSSRVIEVPTGNGALVESLVRLGTQLGERPVLVPCTDLAVLELAKHQKEMRMLYRFAVPKPDVTEMLLDKARFAKFCTIHEFPIPKTFVVSSSEDVETASAEIEYPCILKPSVKSAAWSTHTSTKALMLDSPKALKEAYERFALWANAFVVQEWIVGGDGDHYTCDCYVSAQGVPLVTFSARKIRQWPSGTGQGCLSVECRDEYVRDLTLRVLATAGHQGQGYLETKRDTRSGRHMIVEANVGRPTGRAAAAEKAGVELLMTMYSDLTGAPLPTARTQKYIGTKWIHIRRDLQASVSLLAKREAGIREIAKPWRGPFAFALFSKRDPVPFVADWIHASAQHAGHLWREVRETWGRHKWMRWLAPAQAAGDAGGESDEQESAAYPAPSRAAQADYDIQGVLRVRTRDAWPADLAAVARHLGHGVKPLAGDPDVVVCFVDDLTPHVLERIEGDLAFGDDGIYFLSHTSQPLAHMRLSDPWGSALIVCKRGLGRVPLLSTAFDLAALQQEWIPLRADVRTVNGASVLAVSGQETGSTSARDCSRPVPVGRILWSPDGRTLVRVGKPPHGARTPAPRSANGNANSALPRPDAIVLLETHDRPDVVVERIDPDAAAGRIAAAVGAELRAGLGHREGREGRLAGRGWISTRRAPGVALRLLREATRWRSCYVVHHPEGCATGEIDAAIARFLPDAAITAERAAEAANQATNERNAIDPKPKAPMSSRGRRQRAGSSPSEQPQG